MNKDERDNVAEGGYVYHVTEKKDDRTGDAVYLVFVNSTDSLEWYGRIIVEDWPKYVAGLHYARVGDIRIGSEWRSLGIGSALYRWVERNIIRGRIEAQAVVITDVGYSDSKRTKRYGADIDAARRFWLDKHGFTYNAQLHSWTKVLSEEKKGTAKQYKVVDKSNKNKRSRTDTGVGEASRR